MGRVLAISSQVVRGHVGLSAIVPALQRLGHEVLPLPTIVLSNHPGHKRAAGTRMEISTLASMIEVLDANGWLADLDAVITGYMPTADYVTLIADAIDRVRARSPAALVLVDPVLGDDPRGLYIEMSAARAIRDILLPRADIITPNRFELAWLSGIEVDGVDAVGRARAALPVAERRNLGVVATSIPVDDARIANVARGNGLSLACVVERLAHVPHGTGDLLTGLYIGQLLSAASPVQAFAAAVGGVRQAIANSLDHSDLNLSVAEPSVDWARAAPAHVETDR